MRPDFTNHTTLHPLNCALKLVLIYRPHPVLYPISFESIFLANYDYYLETTEILVFEKSDRFRPLVALWCSLSKLLLVLRHPL